MKRARDLEVALLRELTHPNIVACFGGTTVNGKFALRLERSLCDLTIITPPALLPDSAEVQIFFYYYFTQAFF